MAAATIVVDVAGRPYRKRAIDRAQALEMGAGATGISVPTPSSTAQPRSRGARGRSTRGTRGKDSGDDSLTIPKAKAGLVIGRKGATINEIRDRTGAKLSVEDVDDLSSRVVAKGPEAAVAAALAEVRALLES